MRVARERLIFHALCFLEDEARRAVEEGQLQPSAALRLAIGFLFAVSRDDLDANPEHACRLIWDELTQRSEVNTRTAAGFGRWQTLNSCLNAIAQAAGMPRDHEYDEARSRYRKRIEARRPAKR